MRLNDANSKSAGNIDVVLVAYDDRGKVFDFGALEIQAVYISGNVRDPFQLLHAKPYRTAKMDWSSQPNYPRPGSLFVFTQATCSPTDVQRWHTRKAWQKRTAVAINKGFFATLPPLPSVAKADADIAWLIYDLQLVESEGRQRYKLAKIDEVFTRFEPALLSILPLPPAISTTL